MLIRDISHSNFIDAIDSKTSLTSILTSIVKFKLGVSLFLGEMQRIAFRLMLSVCVFVCVCLCGCVCVYAAFVDARKTV